MRFELKTPLKDQTGKTHSFLIVRPSMKTKDVKYAKELSTKDGKPDAEEFVYHLIASMVGLAYEDVMELDIVDTDKLDTVLAQIRYPQLKEEKEGAKDDVSPKDSTATSSSTKPLKT